MDIHQSPLWAKYMQSLGWEVLDLKSGLAYKRKIPILGSVIKVSKVDPAVDLGLLERLSKKNRALFTKIEPSSTIEDKKTFSSLEKAGFKPDIWSLQPTKTLVIDLTKPESEILTRMEKDTRYSIRAAEKRGVAIEETDDFETFWKLHLQTAKRGKFWTVRGDIERLWKVFSQAKKGVILIAKFSDEPLATAMLLFGDDETAYFYHAGSSQEHRDLFPTYLIVWGSILKAKALGFRWLDLMGIADPRIKSTRSWAGFTHFKKGFGGEEKTYLGSFIKFYNPILGLIFKLNRFF